MTIGPGRDLVELIARAMNNCRTMGQGVAEFLGVSDEPQSERTKRVEKWRERSRRVQHNSMFLGGGFKTTSPDQTDMNMSLVCNTCWLLLHLDTVWSGVTQFTLHFSHFIRNLNDTGTSGDIQSFH